MSRISTWIAVMLSVLLKGFISLFDDLRRWPPNIKELYFRWSIDDSSKTTKETSNLLGDTVTRITDGIRNISFYEHESRDVAYIRPSPLALTGLVHYSVSFNNKQGWLLEVVRRNADTLCKLTIKNMQAERMRSVFKGKNRIPIIYPCLKELTSEWEGTYEAPADDYEVIHFPLLEKLVVGDCCPAISKPFFNGGKSLKYVSIGMKSTALSSKNKYTIFGLCRLDKLQTFVLYQKKNHQYLAFHEAVNIEEIVLIVSILDTSPSLRSFAFQRDAKSDYFLHMILESFALSRIQKLDIGLTMLTLSQLEQIIQKAPQLQQFAYCPKDEYFSFENTMAQALCAFPLSQCFSKVLINKMCCSEECLTNVLFYLVVACPRFANISMAHLWGVPGYNKDAVRAGA